MPAFKNLENLSAGLSQKLELKHQPGELAIPAAMIRWIATDFHPVAKV